MGKYNKFIGAGLGWIFGGPIGALLGLGVGSIVDELLMQEGKQDAQQAQGIQITDASVSLLVLAAAVIRADKKVRIAELNYVRQFFISNYGVVISEQKMRILDQLVRKPIPLADVCSQIRAHTPYPVRLQLIHFLFGIAKSDGHIAAEEIQVITDASRFLGISEADFHSIQAMFYDATDKYYRILEVSPDAPEDTVKKAYRRMAMRFHPDKVNGKGVEFEKAAKEKFQMINEAYNAIRKERGFA